MFSQIQLIGYDLSDEECSEKLIKEMEKAGVIVFPDEASIRGHQVYQQYIGYMKIT